MTTKTKELSQKLEAKQKELADVFTEAGEDLDMDKVKSLEGDSKAKVDWIRQKTEEINETFDELKDEQAKEAAAKLNMEVEEYLKQPVTHPGHPDQPQRGKSFGELFMESKAVTEKAGNSGPVAEIEYDMKTLMTTSAGWAPDTPRGPRVVESAVQPIQLLDLFPVTNTSLTAIKFMEETTFTNNAAEVAEGNTYGEAALALTERSDPVQKIGVWLPITDEQLEDVPQASGYVNNRLPFMLRQRLDGQVINGNGTSPNLSGILDRSGLQTYPLAAEPVPDAIHKGITLVRVTGRALPGAVVMHSNDWQDIRLLRTADGIYIWGSPSEPGEPRIWGLPVVQNETIAEGTALVGDFANFSELSYKRGIEVQVTNSHSTFFIEGKQAMRADVRVALVVYRPSAFCTVTGI